MNENIDKIKENYAEHYDKFNNASLAAFKGAKVYYDAQLSILKHFNLSDKHVLDIGTGNGHLVRYMLDQGAGRITSVEIYPTLYQRAKSVFDANQNVSIYQANIFDFLQQKRSEYDIVVCFDVIEHLPQNEGITLASLIYESLSPKGLCIFRTDNMANIFVGAYSRYMDITHQTGFTEFSLSHLMSFAGFTNIKIIDPSFQPFSRLARNYWLSRLIQSLLIRIQDRRIPKCLHKDIVCVGEKLA